MIDYAITNELERDTWEVWVSAYPHFTQETFVPFNEFKKQQTQNRKPKVIKTNEEINAEMEKVIATYESGVKK